MIDEVSSEGASEDAARGTAARPRKLRRRTQAERRTETRNALIEATIDLLAEGGYANATTTRIARRAGVSLGAMQHHFGSKDELLMGTFDQLMIELTAQMSLDPGKGQALERRVETLVARLWDVYCSPRYVAVWELFLGTRAEPHLRGDAVEHRARSLRIFADLWWSFFKDDGAPEQVVVDVMHTTLAMLRGFAFYSLFESDAAFFTRQRGLLKTFVLEALRSGAQAGPQRHQLPKRVDRTLKRRTKAVIVNAQHPAFEIGVDTGGTFTDLVCHGPGGFSYLTKEPSTPDDPSRAVLQAVDRLMSDCSIDCGRIARFVHGTTVATNAIIERKGARVGLLATQGFKDVLEIGRQTRSGLYDLILAPETPVFLASGRFRRGVTERVAADGSVLVPLDETSVRSAVRALLDLDVEAIAVAYLFSFRRPDHEQRTREIIREMAPELSVSISSEVDPAEREYERTVATAFDAYVKPVVDSYLRSLQAGLHDRAIPASLQVMQSRGGIASVESARRRPVRLTLSGPAGGIVGGRHAAAAGGLDDVITVDIGGTSCDIALISDGKALTRAEGDVAGHPVRVSMVDVNAIGAGGGSIAWIDVAGGLKVGPRSAGSMPGPACYGWGGIEATVTDASVVLGYLNPDYFAGGSVRLDPALSSKVIDETIARPLGMRVEEAALGIHTVLNGQMAEGIRFVSIKQGFDARRFALVPMGGAGGLHAAALADDLGSARILVPPHPGVLAADGLLAAAVEYDLSSPLLTPLESLDPNGLHDAFDKLDARCVELARADGLAIEDTRLSRFADLCYAGQSFHLEVPVDLADPDPLPALQQAFYAAHDRVFGQSTDGPVRVVNLRVVRQSRSGGSTTGMAPPAAPVDAAAAGRPVHFPGAGCVHTAVLRRDALPAGYAADGPVIVEQKDTTVLVPPAWRLTVDRVGNLILTRRADG